jgi:hypothetical protein
MKVTVEVAELSFSDIMSKSLSQLRMIVANRGNCGYSSKSLNSMGWGKLATLVFHSDLELYLELENRTCHPKR